MKKLKVAKRTWKLGKALFHWSWELLHAETRETLFQSSKLEEVSGFRPSEFYECVQALMRDRAIPYVKASRITMAEGGILSPNRKYLRFQFRDLTFDIGAVPLGSRGFFVSLRLTRVKVWTLIAKYLFVFVCLYVFGTILKCLFGWLGVSVAFLLLAGAILSLKREASGATFCGAWEAVFSNTPLINSVYHNLLHPDTRYHEDLRNAFQQAVHKSVLRILEDSHTRKASFRYERPPTLNLFGK